MLGGWVLWQNGHGHLSVSLCARTEGTGFDGDSAGSTAVCGIYGIVLAVVCNPLPPILLAVRKHRGRNPWKHVCIQSSPLDSRERGHMHMHILHFNAFDKQAKLLNMMYIQLTWDMEF